ncbi:N-6 DNA methylase [Amycolatopsis sp. cmx-11-12]|uniref:N-6 DNA methylase n=1 Tax=Amycolatopsis sp. cmx-11-12 TaxID=2785795 RepID=UPI003917334B
MKANERRELTTAFRDVAGILTGRLDTGNYHQIALSVLVLKWASDNPGRLTVPPEASWQHISNNMAPALGHTLNSALHALAHENNQVLGPPGYLPDFTKGTTASELQKLVDLTARISLVDQELDIAGSEIRQELIEQFLSTPGKTHGEFRTPRSVIDLMVRLAQPKDDQSFYDPFMGSGGMLIAAQEHVSEKIGKPATLTLVGQERNAGTFTVAQMNLLLHGITDATLYRDDSLAHPRHIDSDGELRCFDHVLTNPPFSMNYSEHELDFAGRMEYGWTPPRGKKADLMNVQHVLASLKPGGTGAVVSPHGVLFRGGSEQEIRRRMVLDDRIAGVIGIGPNVFYGTGIPACILVLKGKNQSPPDQPPGIFFINAEREITTGRSQNHLDPRHIEKITDTYLRKRTLVGFSRWVPLAEIAENAFNLNIRRYVDTNPHPALMPDPKAILQGGVPAGVIQADSDRFRAYGISLASLFEPRNDEYWDFPDDGYEAVLTRIPAFTSSAEDDFRTRATGWWQKTAERLTGLSREGAVLVNRDQFKNSFHSALSESGILDEYQLYGAFADWWDGNRGTLKWLGLGKASGSERQELLDELGDGLLSLLNALVATGRQELINLYRSWGERYAVSLHDLEARRDAGASRLEERLQQLGYPSPFRH